MVRIGSVLGNLGVASDSLGYRDIVGIASGWPWKASGDVPSKTIRDVTLREPLGPSWPPRGPLQALFGLSLFSLQRIKRRHSWFDRAGQMAMRASWAAMMSAAPPQVRWPGSEAAVAKRMLAMANGHGPGREVGGRGCGHRRRGAPGPQVDPQPLRTCAWQPALPGMTTSRLWPRGAPSFPR